MCMNIEITSIIFEICIVPEPATTVYLFSREENCAKSEFEIFSR